MIPPLASSLGLAHVPTSECMGFFLVVIMRTYVYIDGFNLYYGCLIDSPYKWLNLKSAVQSILNLSDQIICIKYFTARVSATLKDPKKPERQNIYLRALKSYISEIEIYYGKFMTHPVPMRLVTPIGKKKWVEVAINLKWDNMPS